MMEKKSNNSLEMKKRESYDHLFKVILLGNSAVGKTSLIRRFSEEKAYHDHLPTIGVDVYSKLLTMRNKRIKLIFWDTSGQERFHIVSHSHYEQVHAVVFVYSVGEHRSFRDISYWLKEFKQVRPDGPDIGMILGNKCDLQHQIVSFGEGSELAQKMDGLFKENVLFLETSAIDGHNIDKAFSDLTQKLAEQLPSSTCDIGDSLPRVTFPSKHTWRNRLKTICCSCWCCNSEKNQQDEQSPYLSIRASKTS